KTFIRRFDPAPRLHQLPQNKRSSPADGNGRQWANRSRSGPLGRTKSRTRTRFVSDLRAPGCNPSSLGTTSQIGRREAAVRLEVGQASDDPQIATAGLRAAFFLNPVGCPESRLAHIRRKPSSRGVAPALARALPSGFWFHRKRSPKKVASDFSNPCACRPSLASDASGLLANAKQPNSILKTKTRRFSHDRDKQSPVDWIPGSRS